MMRLIGCGTVVVLLSAASVTIPAQAPLPQAREVHKLATTLRGSGCSAAGIETGDPTKAPSIIVEKFAPGCALPWHWHTPNEHVMMVSGTFSFEIHGEKSVQVNAGDFVLIPSRHISQTTCLGPAPCIDNQSRTAINQAIHYAMQDTNKMLYREHQMSVLVARQEITGADRQRAAQYERGNVVLGTLRAARHSALHQKSTRASKAWMRNRTTSQSNGKMASVSATTLAVYKVEPIPRGRASVQ